ncbi:protein translocase subunit SecD [Alphaproteobacteria bacterium]|nr:protein translocase subunit SecD [Alphaproteobacteria bacterium]
MKNSSKIKSFLILMSVLLGVVYAMPNFISISNNNVSYSFLPGKKINLGLDLKGGSYLLLKADMEVVFEEKLQGLLSDIRYSLRKSKIGYKKLIAKKGIVSFEKRGDTPNEKVKSAIIGLNKNLIIDNKNNKFFVNFSDLNKQEITKATMTQAIEIVRRRIDETGTNEPSIQQQGADRIIVQLPGLDDPSRIKKLLGKTAKLNFQLVHPSISSDDIERGSNAPPGYVILEEDKNPSRLYMVNKRVMVSGEMLKDASPTFDRNNSPSVSFQLSPLGGKKFGRVTGQNIGKPFAIILDNKVVSAPVIQSQIFSSGQITGSFSVQETNDLALVLRSGALPAPMIILEERSVGPGLGSDSISSGKIASVAGLIAVMIFMLMTYGIFGIFANIALFCNIIFILALLSLLQATLTLPGIAGIVLTMGMAVDANVLIFERIKEEYKAGREIFVAIESGFQRAISTIIDANLTTLFAALALFSFGSGSIKGFSVTLMIGIITSMFTAIVITKYLVLAYSKKRDIKNYIFQD